MGQDHSSSYVREVGSDDRGVRVFCKMDETMLSSVVLPDKIAKRYRLEFERYMSLTHPDTGVYCCDIEKINGKFRMSRGWDEFIVSAGVVVGDSMLFDIRGADDTVVWVYRDDSNQGAQNGEGSFVRAGNRTEHTVGASRTGLQADPQTDIDSTPQSKLDLHEVDNRESNAVAVAVEGEIIAPFVSGGDEDVATPISQDSGNDMRGILEAWRPKFIVGRNVELEDRMVEFVAAGMDWKLPVYGIYVGKLEENSIESNRMRLPRLYTTEHVMPLLHGKKKTFYMESEREGDRRLKFSIGKDGRAALTEGWAAFATANGLRGGSILAFSFSDKQTELDIAIDVLRE